MIDAVQLVLLIVISVLTILLVALGIQVFFILKQIRVTMKRADKILENAESISENVSEPLSFLSSALFSGKTLTTLIKLFKGDKKEKS